MTSLRSETPERAPWKCRPVESVENSKNEFPTLSTGLGNPAKNKNAGFPHFHRAGGGTHLQGRLKKMRRKPNSS
jgi:hypothetical protein